MNPINYIIRQLSDIGYTTTEITNFLTLIYNNRVKHIRDLESQIAQSGNLRYIEAYSLLNEDINTLDDSKLKEWYNSL